MSLSELFKVSALEFAIIFKITESAVPADKVIAHVVAVAVLSAGQSNLAAKAPVAQHVYRQEVVIGKKRLISVLLPPYFIEDLPKASVPAAFALV